MRTNTCTTTRNEHYYCKCPNCFEWLNTTEPKLGTSETGTNPLYGQALQDSNHMVLPSISLVSLNSGLQHALLR